jgi:hypothetical protein
VGQRRKKGEGRKKEGKKGKKERGGKKKRKEGKVKKEKKIGKKKGKEKGIREKGKKGKKGEGFRKLGEILGKLEGRGRRDFVGFSGFSGVSVIFGTVVMARRTGRRDRGLPRIPGKVADSGTGAARGVRRWPEWWWAVPAGFAACVPREGERRKDDRVFGKVIELSGKVLKIHVI